MEKGYKDYMFHARGTCIGIVLKRTKYLWLSLLSFGAFMLEYLSIFAIEVIILHVDIQNYTMQKRSIYCIIMVFMWALFIGVLLLFSRKHYHFPERGSKRDKISLKAKVFKVWMAMRPAGRQAVHDGGLL
ncbi:hypothetical protein [Eubacterium sp. 14-2]|uniref:hypothetical protein n=1 Tax=Eubacterium sp. 14-2 TaxID=1235790 RepID=UPI0003B4B7A1|nr:hypothetical protein [Eubacterium sp. 14-2]